MEVKVEMPPSPPSLDSPSAAINNIDLNSRNCSTPFISAPSSPQRPFNLFFYSAPASPRSSSSFFHGVDDVIITHPSSPSAVVPFNWETHPGVPKPSGEDEGFEFDFTNLRPSLSSADELFSGGKIRPLKAPPATISTVDSPKFKGAALSPKQRMKDLEEKEDPFEVAFKNATKLDDEINPKFKSDEQIRGRSGKNPQNSRSNSRRKGISRSLSPLRVSESALLNYQELPPNPNRSSNNGGGSSSSKGIGRKWRLKDLLLFRSASEGRATTIGKDPLRKYFSLPKKTEDEGSKSLGSFRSNASSSGSSMADVGSISRRRRQVSAHELHYTANRAVAEGMKKKTSLPYKHGLLGCLGLGFNPAFDDISKAVRSFAP